MYCMTLVWNMGLQSLPNCTSLCRGNSLPEQKQTLFLSLWILLSLLRSLLLGKEKGFLGSFQLSIQGEHKYVCAGSGENQKGKTNWFVVWQCCLTFCFPEPRKRLLRHNAPPLLAHSSLRIWHHPGENESDTSLITASSKASVLWSSLLPLFFPFFCIHPHVHTIAKETERGRAIDWK